MQSIKSIKSIKGSMLMAVGAALLHGSGGGTAAWADAVSAEIRITAYRGTGANANNLGFPYIDLRNTADTADIVGYRITIGDTSYFWDGALINASSQIPASNLTIIAPGSSLDDLAASDDVIHMTFAPGIFTPGTVLSHRNDIDRDAEAGVTETYPVDQPDFRQVLFDLDGSDDSDNALITITFSDGQVIQQRLPDFSSTDENTSAISSSTHNFGYIRLDQVVPEPMSLAMLSGGLLLLTPRRRRG